MQRGGLTGGTHAGAAQVAVDHVAHPGPYGEAGGQGHHSAGAHGALGTFLHGVHDAAPQRSARPRRDTNNVRAFVGTLGFS